MAGEHGGARAGSGRKPKKKAPGTKTKGKIGSLDYLEAVINDNEADPTLRLRAAIAVASYRNTKRAHGGKKEEKDRAARSASSGKFGPAAAPKLVVNNK